MCLKSSRKIPNFLLLGNSFVKKVFLDNFSYLVNRNQIEASLVLAWQCAINFILKKRRNEIFAAIDEIHFFLFNTPTYLFIQRCGQSFANRNVIHKYF